ncbi:MAG: hypothetical protein R6U17_03260 [Thermoplasmata archaeon]
MSVIESLLDPRTGAGKVLVFIMVFILPIPIIFGVFLTHYEQRRVVHPDPSMHYSYSVTVETHEDMSYILYLPTWISPEGDPIQEIRHIEFTKGQGDVDLVDTDHGAALAVETRGPVELSFSRRNGEMDILPAEPPTMSMMAENETEQSYRKFYRVYLETQDGPTPLNLTLSYSFDATYICEAVAEMVTITGALEEGWIILEGERW